MIIYKIVKLLGKYSDAYINIQNTYCNALLGMIMQNIIRYQTYSRKDKKTLNVLLKFSNINFDIKVINSLITYK